MCLAGGNAWLGAFPAEKASWLLTVLAALSRVTGLRPGVPLAWMGDAPALVGDPPALVGVPQASVGNLLALVGDPPALVGVPHAWVGEPPDSPGMCEGA